MSSLDDRASQGPLTGVRVVALEGMGPSPVICMLLADMGADVVRVRRPARSAGMELGAVRGIAPGSDIVNRHSVSVTANLKDPAELERVRQLIDHAEVFVEGYRPGVCERLGLGPEILLARRPSLVYARVTGYGQDGPLAQSPGHDINYTAQSGVLSAIARAGQKPLAPINLLADYAGGGGVGAFGVVCALFHAARSGQGQVVDISMVETLAVLTAKVQAMRSAGAHSDVPGTNVLDSGAPFYDTYECADGRYLAVGSLEPAFYDNFLAGLDVDRATWPDWTDRAQWDELRRRIADRVAERTRDEWTADFEGMEACVSPVLTFDEALEEAHNRHRRVYERLGGVQHPGAAPRMGRTPARSPAPAPSGDEPIEALLRRWSETTDAPLTRAATDN